MVIKPLKLLAIGLISLFMLATAAGVVFWRNIDNLAHRAVESGGTAGLGLDTRAKSVHVKLLGGAVGVRKVSVANVKGYREAHLLSGGDIDVDVHLRSLLEDTVVVPRIRIDNLRLTLEQKGLRNNVSELLEALARKAEGSSPAESSSKRLRIDRVEIRNLTAEVQLLPIGGKASTVKVVVPELILDDVTPEGAKAMAVSELTRRLFPAIVAAVLDAGKGVLPVDLVGRLGKDVVAAVTQIGGGAVDLVAQVAGGAVERIVGGAADVAGKAGEGLGQAAGKVGNTVGDAVQGAGEGLRKVGDGVGEGLRGIFGGKKEDQP